MNLTEYSQIRRPRAGRAGGQAAGVAQGTRRDRAEGDRGRQPHHQRGGGDLPRSHRRPRRSHARQWPVPRRAVPDQGRVRPREGPQDRVRQPAVPRHAGRGGQPRRRAVPGQRRQHPGPLGGARVFDVGHHRVGLLRQHLQSLEAGLFGGRLDRRRPGGGDLGHGAAGARLRHRRLDPHPGELVRRRGAQAVARARVERPVVRRGRLRHDLQSRAGKNRARCRRHARLHGGAAGGRPLPHPEAVRALRQPRRARHRRGCVSASCCRSCSA